MIDEILYSKTRLLEGQSLRCVGGLENSFDINSFTGINFNNPLILKESPMALAIGNHLHYNTVKHMGAESVYRLSQG